MERIIHPISGETGFFASEREKVVIDVALRELLISQFVLTSADGRGVSDE